MRKITFLILILIIMCTIFVSCAKDSEDGGVQATEELPLAVDISSLELSEYIELGEYRGLTVSYDSSKLSKGDAAFLAVLENSTVKAYPEGQVEYYVAQARASYEYLAKRDGVSRRAGG